MPRPSEIDRLLEEGLARYGAGELDAALEAWERALAIDPDNAQANSYVDYVRMNYDVLTADSQDITDGFNAPFGIEEEPEYQIEITEGELATGDSPPLYMDPLDAGWFIEEATHDHGGARSETEKTTPVETSEPEAEAEPGEIMELEADEPPLPPPEGISFDDSTSEYPGGPPRASHAQAVNDFSTPEPPTSEFAQEEATGGFGTSEQTPIGWGTQATDVRKRDLGFVQPRQPAELKVTVRTPQPQPVPQPVTDKPSSPLSIGTASTRDLELGGAGLGETEPTAEHPPIRGAYEDGPAVATAPTADLPPTRIPTLDLPPPVRAPAELPQTAYDDISLSPSPTGDFAAVTAKLPSARELGLVPESETAPEIELRPSDAPEITPVDPMVAAPTRELGLRPTGRAATGLGEDDEAPTKQSDARAIRTEHAQAAVQSRPLTAGTRQDIVLPFDPIDARSAQILDDVDADAPATEAKEDRTRRRITDLIERAVAWSGISELDKAVTAVDLALSEDPNSPLAQKLIHRNRDTIMMVLQSYLGDLERQPQLAKPLHELARAPISPRAAFLLSRIDGSLTIDEVLDVSGMPRLEAYRLLSQLFLRGILR